MIAPRQGYVNEPDPVPRTLTPHELAVRTLQRRWRAENIKDQNANTKRT